MLTWLRTALLASWLAGGTLVAAGSLKLADLWTRQFLSVSSWPTAVAALELAFGFWLIVGLAPRLSRWLAVVCFLAFANVALTQAFDAKPSCGCFGKVDVNPWWTFGGDVSLVVGLLLTAPLKSYQSSGRRRILWTTLAIGSLAAAVQPYVSILRVCAATAAEKSDRSIRGRDEAAFARVRTAIHANRERSRVVSYTATVDWEGRSIWAAAGNPNQPGAEPDSHLTQTTRCRFADDRERVAISGSQTAGAEATALSGEVASYGGVRVHYDRTIKHARFERARGPNHYDIRNAGAPAGLELCDTLDSAALLAAESMRDATGGEIVRARFTVHEPGSKPYEMLMEFEERCGYLPTCVVAYFSGNEGVWSATTIRYSSHQNVWLPISIKLRSFVRGPATTPDSDTGWNIDGETVVRDVRVGDLLDLAACDFDIPPATRLVGMAGLASRTRTTGQRASEFLTALSGKPPATLAPTAAQVVRWYSRPTYWPIAVIGNACCLALALRAFRRGAGNHTERVQP